MNAAAAIADAELKRDGRDWPEKRHKHGQGSHVTRVALLPLVARPLPHTMGKGEGGGDEPS